MKDTYETQRDEKKIYLQIKKWLFKYYENYSPAIEDEDKLSITYIENQMVYKLVIQICEHTKNIRYFVDLPYYIDPCINETLIDQINTHHVNSCIGRFELDKKKGKLRFNYWNSYNPQKLDFDLIDNGMGIAMICCKETFGIIDKGVVKFEQDNLYV